MEAWVTFKNRQDYMPQNLDPTDTTKFCACFAKHLGIAIPGEKVEEIRIRYVAWKKDFKTWRKGQERREKNKYEMLNYYLDY